MPLRPAERSLMAAFGERLRLARTRREITASDLAARAQISRTTLQKVESGHPAVTLGTYVRVMSVLGLHGSLDELARDDPVGRLLVDHRQLSLARRRRSSDKEPPSPVHLEGDESLTISTTANHEPQDAQSLLMHRAATKLLGSNPALAERALQTLDRWRASGPSSTQPLWDEWRSIIERSDWNRAVEVSEHGQQLRQASPLPCLLPQETRLAIIASVRKAKEKLLEAH